MKKYFCILVCALFVLTGISSQAFAASMYDVANGGTYLIQFSEKLKVKKGGKDSDTFVVTCDFTAHSPVTGSFALSDNVITIGGTCILNKGKKLFCELNSSGSLDLALAVGGWIELLASQKNIFFPFGWIINYDVPVTFKVKVDKNTGRPKKKSKLKLKGQFEGNTNQGFMSLKYLYKGKMEFL